MPNGGTDCCMNCRYNKFNQQSENVKSATQMSRFSFCTVHNIPIEDFAWTYCKNIYSKAPDISIPIESNGLKDAGYERIPWFGRTRPITNVNVNNCEVCGELTEDTYGISIKDSANKNTPTFCSNEHYVDWIKEQTSSRTFEEIYSINRNQIHESIINKSLDTKANFASILIDGQDDLGWTPIHLAAYLGDIDAVNILLDNKADACIGPILPIELAGSEGHTEVVKLLFDYSYPSRESREEALFKSSENGHLEIVEALVNSGVPVDVRNDKEKTPLHLAVWEGNYTIAVFLLDQGADVNAVDRYGNSPMSTVETWYRKSNQPLYELIHAWHCRSK
jgi:hypothetical protein